MNLYFYSVFLNHKKNFIENTLKHRNISPFISGKSFWIVDWLAKTLKIEIYVLQNIDILLHTHTNTHTTQHNKETEKKWVLKEDLMVRNKVKRATESKTSEKQGHERAAWKDTNIISERNAPALSTQYLRECSGLLRDGHSINTRYCVFCLYNGEIDIPWSVSISGIEAIGSLKQHFPLFL